MIEKLAKANHGIQTRYLLRNENPQLMDQFLTRGSRSIAKLIAVDEQNWQVLGSWGPRPEAAKCFREDLKANGAEKGELLERTQRWYNDNKSSSTQSEFAELVKVWDEKAKSLAEIAIASSAS